ncbi:4-hydroxy-tetrahydrodipicolinate synthase [Eupransor demetentiae]|uniref:4-hydroxy-tetrahydrodipicolinate synthase n=1 Tax=Eupransor demetentiae TaxID=3109584 RepID=A0ABP0ETP6_9LACO|nr:4-hydroxy-tetrahydrodipicolinate synthase/N-acetylneuraminate lyase (DapA) [Lactobacillaceae bacterium LMG 33000]
MFENADLITALITPFNEENQVDYDTLEELTERYLSEGVRGFVIGGTTGETPTLSAEEKLDLYRHFAQIVNGRVPVIAGLGSNDTAATVDFAQQVNEIDGISAALVVVPYYNKPDQRRMFEHFTAVAEASDHPVIIYNIPGRTGVTMSVETILGLAQNPNIIGVKECTGMEDLEALVQQAPADFNVYSGEDAQALFAKVVGARGVISVAAHVYAPQMRAMYDALEAGDYRRAGTLQCLLTPKMAALFMYPSPAPVKAILNAQGYQVGACRAPILPLNMAEEHDLARHLGLAEDVFDNARERKVMSW